MDLSTLTTISRFATPEVFTVVGGLTAAWIGWKIAAKGIGLISIVAQKASFLGLAAAVLFVSGLGSMGLGTGELISRMPEKAPATAKTGMYDANLLTLAKEAKDPQTASMILEYARHRDGVGSQNEDYRLLINMVQKQLEKTTNTSEDQEHAHKMLTSLIELAKIRKPEGETMTLEKRSDLTTANFAGYHVSKTNYDGSTIEEKQESVMQIPFSVSLIGTGFGLAVCGVICNNRRKKELGIN